ncbi:MAG TPA: DUF362 domain-containing protein [Nitrospirota bacterium]|nr:DUF362 domain-containing protein [Nitrospirota bacterium]
MDKSMNTIRNDHRTKVSLIKTRDRKTGIMRAIDLLDMNPAKGKDVLIKPNFNTADHYPASTHNDTLACLMEKLKAMGAKSITIGERSGPPDTADVIKKKGILQLCQEYDARIINFEDLSEKEWIRFQPNGSHWRNGFRVAKPVLDSSCVVSTCCLKTHGYGGVFTMSLKLSVGVTHKKNMTELHSSFLSMRKMIAEINTAYRPALIVMDGIDAFVDKGPSHGPMRQADVILAGTDRIAIDAVGVAVLKSLGSNRAIMGKKIFEQEQISRAVELGLGILRPGEIEIVADDAAGKEYAERLVKIVLQG